MENKITFKTMLSAYMRGIKLMRELLPWHLTRCVIYAVAKGAPPLLLLVFSARLIDELAGARDLNRIILYAALAVGVTFLSSATGAIIVKMNNHHTVLLARLHRSEHFAGLDFEHTEDSRVRELMSTIDGQESWSYHGLVHVIYKLPQLLDGIVGLIGAIALLVGFISNGGFAAIIIFAPIIPVLARIPIVKAHERLNAVIQVRMPKLNAAYTYYLGEYVPAGRAGKDVRIYNQKAALTEILSRLGFPEMIEMLRKYAPLGGSIPAAINAAISAAAYLLIGLRALAGAITIGQVTQYVGAVTSFVNGFGGLVSTLTELRLNTPHLIRYFEFLDLPDIKYRGTISTEKRSDFEYDFEFKNVSFRYPGTDSYALRDLNLKLRVGQKLAVVGMNGSGKTTMIKLLCRLYDPTEGEITLNGIDIRKYDYLEYMSLFAAVFQDFKLLAFSLGQNVAASAEYDRERVATLLKTVGFGEKYGLDTPLYKSFDENGVEVSGGEAQKLALARALYRNSPVIILDEPTAALDPIAESEIYSHFDSIVGERTAIYISHRLSSCRFCDDIAVFHEGALVQRGGHDDLLAQTGKYRELWTAQAQYYE